MSALNVFVDRESVHIFTDGAAYVPDGTLAGMMTKTHALPQISGAMASIGNSTASLAAFSGTMEIPNTEIGEFVEAFATGLRGLRHHPALNLDYCEFAVAGLDDDGPVAYVIPTFSDDGKPAFAPRKVRKFSRPYDGSMIGVTFDPARPEEAGLAILEAQRRGRFETPAGLVGHLVGGFAHYTQVGRDGLTMRVLRRWPDIVGEKIAA